MKNIQWRLFLENLQRSLTRKCRNLHLKKINSTYRHLVGKKRIAMCCSVALKAEYRLSFTHNLGSRGESVFCRIVGEICGSNGSDVGTVARAHAHQLECKIGNYRKVRISKHKNGPNQKVLFRQELIAI
jgi:hypothetical protein